MKRHALLALFALLPMLLGVVAYVVSWWREWLGSILLIAAYIVLGSAPSLHGIVYEDGFHFYVGNFILALPFLAAGILLLFVSRLSGQVDK